MQKHDLKMQGENKDHNENELQIFNKNYKTQPRKEKPWKETSYKQPSPNAKHVSKMKANKNVRQKWIFTLRKKKRQVEYETQQECKSIEIKTSEGQKF